MLFVSVESVFYSHFVICNLRFSFITSEIIFMQKYEILHNLQILYFLFDAIPFITDDAAMF